MGVGRDPHTPLCPYLHPVCLCCVKVIGKSSEVATEGGVEEKYLIATSEQPLCALHRLVIGG